MNNRRSSLKIISKLIIHIKPLLLFMVLAVILGCTGFICAIFIPILGSIGIISAFDSNIGITPSAVFGCIIAFGILRGLLRYGEQACNHYIAFRLLAVIRDKVFFALRRLCPAKLEGQDKGNLISLITSDVELLEVFYAHTISPVIIAILVSLTMILFMGSICPATGILAAAAYSVVGIVIPIINSRLTGSSGMEYRKSVGDLNTAFLESLRGLGELIQYNKTELKKNELNEHINKLEKVHRDLKKREIDSINLTEMSIFAFNFIMLALCGYLYIVGSISFSVALICSVSLISSYGPVIAISSLSNNLAQTLASGERILSLLDDEPETAEITNGKNIKIDSVECDELSFSYNRERILSNISLTVKPGEITGIYGKSGCGKSTLLKLIMRFWERDSGTLTLSGTNIDKINTKCLRHNESYCTQETYLFNDTIGNNILVAKPDASEQEMIQAAKSASAHEFISALPDGYNTPIGELGDRLSGGEKQRIGLARAFLCGAPLMLLDEPTSNLDSLNEAVILKSLHRAKDKTVILVSHRKSTLGIADKIYSLNSERNS